jgi:arylsulfatase A-like enzyme
MGIDGLRPDAIAPARTPTLDMLFEHGAGTLAASTQLTGDTVSGPGWASILTGVEVERHGVTSNDTAVMQGIDRGVPTMLGAAFDAGLDTGLIVHWLQLPLLVEAGPMQGFRFGDDATVASTAVRYLTQPRDLLFLHFDDCDHAGHATGYGPSNPDYLAAVEGVDTHLATVLDGVLERPTYAEEAWMFVLVTDHGGEGTGHGPRNAINQTIPLLFVRPGMTPATLSAGNHMDVAPTVLSYLGVDLGAVHDGVVVEAALASP